MVASGAGLAMGLSLGLIVGGVLLVAYCLLLADTDGSVGRSYGTLGGSGVVDRIKTAVGMAKRVTFVIDERGRIAHVIDKPDVANHAAEVLALL